MSATPNTRQDAPQSQATTNQDCGAGPTVQPSGDGLPEYDTVIIHADGSYQQEEDLSGVGFTIETNTGETIHEAWDYTPDANTSMETEAAAALIAVRAAKLYSPSFIILYSDCKPLVDRLADRHSPDGLRNRYAEIYGELDTVEFTSVKHISRTRNRRADELAHRALEGLRSKQNTDTGSETSTPSPPVTR